MTRPGAGVYVGRPVRRVNDRPLLDGDARFVDDLRGHGLYATILRSTSAHGVVERFDATHARGLAGVVAVLGPSEIVGAVAPMECTWVLPGQRQHTYPVVENVVRYVGQPLGILVATSHAAAIDAAEQVEIDYHERPAVVDVERALEGVDGFLYPELGTNLIVELRVGNTPAAVAAVVAGAAHVVRRRFRVPRQSAMPMEPRGVRAEFDRATGALTVWTSTQVPHHVREDLAAVLGMRLDRVRVVAPNVGGGFGPKDHLYPDEVLVCLASCRLGATVKWIEQRREHAIATVHARDQTQHATLAFDADGRFLAIDAELIVDLGAQCTNVGAGPAFTTASLLEGPYRFDAAGSTVRGVVTNKTPAGAYRGFGQPEAAWPRELLIDEAAVVVGLSPTEIRRRNMIERAALPFLTHSGQSYDSGDFAAALVRAEAMISTPQRSLPTRAAVRHGIGIASYVQFAGSSSRGSQSLNFRIPGYETAVLRMEADGNVTLYTGVCPHGQGLETTLAQVAADHLGVPFDTVTVVFGDTATTPVAAGTIASRSMMMGGAATMRAAAALRARLLEIAAHRLEAAVADLELNAGRIAVRGTPTIGLAVVDIARDAWLGWNLPAGAEPGLEVRAVFDPDDAAYSYATHAVAIAVDIETGRIDVQRYVVVQDCGVIVNPMIVEGQIHGGVAQGIGGALLEEMIYDGAGQPLTTSFLDYELPSACEVPFIEVEHLVHPSPRVPGGMKGMAEGGLIPSAAAIANALADAVPGIAEMITDTPLTPERVWRWLRQLESTPA